MTNEEAKEMVDMRNELAGYRVVTEKLLAENRALYEALTHAQVAGSRLQTAFQPILGTLQAIIDKTSSNHVVKIDEIRGFAENALEEARALALPDYARKTS